ncbi:MAG: hypothetical protein OFPII_40550 [Osedax symbiont Rs1]|nr:MAG: hypothetical protein OFPII_40550 [Osedax symbiont Rs1]
MKKSLKDWFYHRGHREEIKSIFCYGGDTGLIRKRFDNSVDQHCTGCEELLSPETAVFAPQELHSVSFLIEGSFTVSFYKIDHERPEVPAATS